MELEILENNINLRSPGIIYVPDVPYGLSSALLRGIMYGFGEIGKIYLVPKATRKRKNFNIYSHGWVEFLNKSDAKRAVKELNGKVLPDSKKKLWDGVIFQLQYLKGKTWSIVNGEDHEVAYEMSQRKMEGTAKAKIEGKRVKTVLSKSLKNKAKFLNDNLSNPTPTVKHELKSMAQKSGKSSVARNVSMQTNLFGF